MGHPRRFRSVPVVTGEAAFDPQAPAGRVEAVVFDLDGVIRHYDRVAQRRVEQRHDLAEGALFNAAFGGPLGRRFVRGELDHDEFALAIGDVVGSVTAATEFLALRADVDHAVVALISEVRSNVPVALLTNGSRRTRIELAETGLADAFDHVFNSAETGIPKPEPGAYLNVVAALGLSASAAAFVDDHPGNVAAAVELGMVGHHYLGIEQLRSFLRLHLDGPSGSAAR